MIVAAVVGTLTSTALIRRQEDDSEREQTQQTLPLASHQQLHRDAASVAEAAACHSCSSKGVHVLQAPHPPIHLRRRTGLRLGRRTRLE